MRGTPILPRIEDQVQRAAASRARVEAARTLQAKPAQHHGDIDPAVEPETRRSREEDPPRTGTGDDEEPAPC